MTTNASKFGLRKAAEERSNRHAQRTPLPPRRGVVAAARETSLEIRSLKDAADHGDGADIKSWNKAEAFKKLAVAAKWQVSTEPRGDVVELTATRDSETIVQAWRNGVWQYDASVYAFADRTTKPRNASGAATLLNRSPEKAAAEAVKVAANNSFRKRTPTDLAPIALPLDPDLLTDEEAAKFFKGQTVRWYNRMSRSPETAMVSKRSTVRVTRFDGEVTVSFCCPVSGFRAFHLSAVLAVGRGRVLSAETGEIELEEAA